jgi:hypothetical protein
MLAPRRYRPQNVRQLHERQYWPAGVNGRVLGGSIEDAGRSVRLAVLILVAASFLEALYPVLRTRRRYNADGKGAHDEEANTGNRFDWVLLHQVHHPSERQAYLRIGLRP